MRQLSILTACVLSTAAGALAIDESHLAKAREMYAKSAAYMKARQHERGGWSISPEGPQFPAVTALVLDGLLLDPTRDPGKADPIVDRAAAFILSYAKPDGGIYDSVLPSYNTSICLSALAKLRRPADDQAIQMGVRFLRQLQFSEEAHFEGASIETLRVTRDHPFYGGVGYGRHGRPDNSNLSFALQALHDAGVPGSDPAFQRALVFLSRTQMSDRVNDMPYADGSRQGGFIYATAENKDAPGVGQSFAGMIEETVDAPSGPGTASRLRAYGSMTYAGFKCLIYAELPPTDPRMVDALAWISANYMLGENPGVGADGLYYYFLAFARAMDAHSGPGRIDQITVNGPDGKPEVRDWSNDLIDRLAELQNEDGSFKSVDDRWMENNPELITAYSMIALGLAMR